MKESREGREGALHPSTRVIIVQNEGGSEGRLECRSTMQTEEKRREKEDQQG